MTLLVDNFWQAGDPDFTLAFGRAFAQGAITGQAVTMLDKTYPVTTLAALPAGATLEGVSRINSCISTSVAVGDVITAPSWVSIQKVQINSSVVRTAGNFINVTGSEFLLDDFTLSGGFNGITIGNGLSKTQITNGIIISTATNGVAVTYGAAGGVAPVCNFMSDIMMNSANAVAANISLINCGDLTLDAIQALSAVNNLLVQPPAGCSVASLKAIGCFFDHASGSNLLAHPGGGGGFYRSDFTNCWFGSGAVNNASLWTTDNSFVDNISFSQCDGVLSPGSGFVCIGQISNCAWHGGRLAGNVDGFYLSPALGFGGLEVKNAKIGACGGIATNTNGGLLLGAGGHNQIAWNDFIGDTFTNTNTGAGNVVTPNIVR